MDKGDTTSAPGAHPHSPPRFEVADEAGYAYLEEHGYAVFKDVVTPDQLVEGRKLAWDFLESIPNASIKRDDPATWNDNWPDPFQKGIIVLEGVGHSPFLWFTRALPTVQTIYTTIWHTPDLATSFDGFCMFRPFEYNEQWATNTGWYHLDQNGRNKPDKICVQGFVNYYDSGDTDGGLVVVPGSHKVFKDIFRNHPHLGTGGDFVKLEKFGPDSPWQQEIKQAGLRPIKVCAMAGDMVLWDSRVIHCSSPPTTVGTLPTDGSVLPPRRLVAYVCMTPAARLTPYIIRRRQEAYLRGHTFSHWPEEVKISGAASWGYQPPELDPSLHKLIPMDPLYIEDDDQADDDEAEN